MPTAAPITVLVASRQERPFAGYLAEMLRIDTLLYARASQAWHGLSTEIAASATPSDRAGQQ